ncbi:hypothetical protein [Sneathiella limimaris]|uniref:hypothetical protein n=1 Tax=Sneathiella limimaris TaxID=1964213 RepID=UPI00146D2885|nr:hypothetical protein [Sneathiella limimaris]
MTGISSTAFAAEPPKTTCLKMNALGAISEDLEYIGRNFKALMDNSGICVEILNIPWERSIEMLRDREIDGFVVLSEEFEPIIENFTVQVEVPFGRTDTQIVFWPHQDVEIKSVGIIRGNKWAQRLLNLNPPPLLASSYTLVEGRTYENLFSLLSRNRIQAIIGTVSGTQSSNIDRLGLATKHLGVLYGYTYLHKNQSRYASLISKVYRSYTDKGCVLLDRRGIKESCLPTN